MKTLVIHAPDAKRSTTGQPKKIFEKIFKDGLGPGYAIFQKDHAALRQGDTVVLLRKNRNEKRAEGRLVELVDTGTATPQGVKRYDVHFEDRKMVTYRSERLNRFGVAVI